MRRDFLVAVIIGWLFPLHLFAQRLTGEIHGKVVDGATQQPLPGVNVRAAETAYGAATNERGIYRVVNMPVGTYRLRFSMVGYQEVIKTDVVVKSNKATIGVDVEMQESLITIQGAIVTVDPFLKSAETPVSAHSLDYEEIRRAPGSAEDISRAIRVLPSVALASDRRNDLIVRGGSPSENLVLVDGIETPNINHYGSQGASGGPIGMLNVDFVREANFLTGGFPARYGDKLSSVLDIKLREGNREQVEGDFNLSMAGYGGMFEGPLPQGRGSWMISARKSYLELLEGQLGYDGVPKYGDVQGKIVYELNTSNKLTFLGLGGQDNFETNASAEANDGFTANNSINNDQYQYVLGLSWQSLWSKNGYSTISLSRSVYDQDAVITRWDGRPRSRSRWQEAQWIARIDAHHKLGSASHLSAGLQAKSICFPQQLFLDEYRNENGDLIGSLSIDQEIKTSSTGGYLQFTDNLNHRLSASSGVRWDYFDFTGANNFSPRISLSYHFTDRLTLNGSWGIFYQTPPLSWLTADPRNADLKNFRADHYVVGVDYHLAEDTKLTVEVYDKEYRDYPVSTTDSSRALSNFGANFGIYDVRHVVNGGSGIARGVEVLLQKKLFEKYYGIISYGYSRSKFKGIDGTEIAGDFDVRHVANFVVGYKPNEKWEFSLKWAYAGGRPYTPFDMQASKQAGQGILDLAQLNARRYPAYHRLDVRFDRRYHLKKLNIVTYFDLQNAYNRKNVNAIFWNEARNEEAVSHQWEILPVGGLSVEF